MKPETRWKKCWADRHSSYEEETERTMTALTSLVEPFILVIMGMVIGFVLLAVLLPIFELSGLIG